MYTDDTWKDRVQILLNDYRPDDIFSADEMDLFHTKKDSLSVLLCCNESRTEMLKPLVIGLWCKLSDSAVVEDTDETVTISKEWQQIARTNATFSDYVDCDSSLFAFQQSSLKEILEQHQADANQEDNDDDDDDDKEQEALPILTLTAALEAMDTARRYVSIFNVDENVINQLSKIDTVICELGKKT
ncbi:hypothetical protein T03_1306 [Trichinella britovi]|uniref:DDE-1 domain-containing protein n=1 Tax=Trichinella britovi TaxID=45882 RepID=A0A0V1CDB6_TRIBR|nr:hypothetical protein T03_1306 [Trichinella britovi]